MTDAMLEAFRHNAWATRSLIEHLGGLEPAQLEAVVPGGYGNPLATLQHILGAEAFYRSLFSGAFPRWDWPDDRQADIEQLSRWAADMAAFWEAVLAGPVEADQLLVQNRPDGSTRQFRAGVLLAQALHHANVHREQVCAVLTSLGLEPPDLSGWAYGYATGRIVRS